jgi:hypothetical protein
MKTYNLVHICIKSEDELMHRDEEDYRCGISKMAYAALRTESHIYAYAFMSTHVHVVVQSSDCPKFISLYRSAYTRWFNHKYCRAGRLGERYYHTEYLETPYRILYAVNYVLRNPVHHLVSDSALGYEFCSARYVFAGDFRSGDLPCKRRTTPFLSTKITLPESFSLNEKGMISPESFLEIKAVENLYGTVKSFMYYINRPSFKDLGNPQDTGENPLTIDMIEPSFNIEELRENEQKRSVKGYAKDIDVCRIIDKECLQGKSYTRISGQEKTMIANILLRRFKGYISIKQINRCLFSRE